MRNGLSPKISEKQVEWTFFYEGLSSQDLSICQPWVKDRVPVFMVLLKHLRLTKEKSSMWGCTNLWFGLTAFFVYQDCWQCTNCKKFNSPIKRYCFRCWALRKDWFSDCPKLVHSFSTSNIATMLSKEDPEGMDVPDCRRTVSAPIVRPKDLCRTEVKPDRGPRNPMESMHLAQKCEVKQSLLQFSKCEQKEEEEVQSSESSKELLKPCLMCQKRPRNGNIVHGRSAHLVACFTCAKMLKKGRLPCPVCKKQIQMVIKTFIA